jgi:hypothetical protein
VLLLLLIILDTRLLLGEDLEMSLSHRDVCFKYLEDRANRHSRLSQHQRSPFSLAGKAGLLG